MGKLKNHDIRVEFQVCGSPHVYCLPWVVNAPVLTLHNKQKYVDFVDQAFYAYLPDINENPELHDLVKLYQLHIHSVT